MNWFILRIEWIKGRSLLALTWGHWMASGHLPQKAFSRQCVKVLVAQSNLTVWDPMDCSPRGSSVHGILPGKDTGVGCHFLV